MAELSLEHWFREVKRRGFRVNNLVHVDSGMWRCSLRTADNKRFYQFGNGVDPAHAIEEALHKAATTAPVPPFETPGEVRAPNLPPLADEDDLIG